MNNVFLRFKFPRFSLYFLKNFMVALLYGGQSFQDSRLGFLREHDERDDEQYILYGIPLIFLQFTYLFITHQFCYILFRVCMIDEAFLLVVFVFVVIRLGNFTKGRGFFSFFCLLPISFSLFFLVYKVLHYLYCLAPLKSEKIQTRKITLNLYIVYFLNQDFPITFLFFLDSLFCMNFHYGFSPQSSQFLFFLSSHSPP